MSFELLKNKRFLDSAEMFFQKHKDRLLDIVLFGSAVRGKEEPADIDVLLLFKEKESIDLVYRCRKELESASLRVEVVGKSYEQLFKPSFQAREAFLSEGYSLAYGRFVAEGLGYAHYTLFRYELIGRSPSERVRFYYSFNGRGRQAGMAKVLGLKKFSDSVFLCPVEHVEQVREYLGGWKIKYEAFPVLLPLRLVR